ncbi:diguanylate cyclase domain-containing protein [Acidovorax sp. SDU_ACID1]|uniref:diguanylate cyclase domain-containing protein n=1 Tax=Acidovorax sp. SDU_ACID1 TaxID=3136632 RepID=UPI003873B17B
MPSANRSSLKLSLVLPFIALIALLTGTLGVLWYWTGSRTVSMLSQQLMTEMAARIGQAVDQHVQGSGAMLEAAFPDSLPAGPDIARDLPALRERLWIATSLSGQAGDYVYYGNRAGQGIGLKRLGHDLGELRLKTRAEDHRRYYRLDGIAARPIPQSLEASPFDPRTRPWFKQARTAAGHVWTPVYIDFNARDLVMTRARRVLSPTGEFEGVVAADVFLHALQQFMAGLPMVTGGRAFILEPGGALIAASDMPNIREGSDGTPERVNAANCGDPLIEAIHAQLRPLLQSAGPAAGAPQLIDAHGKAVQIAYRQIVDSAGLDWVAVVALPHDDMLAGMRRHVVLMAALGLCALGLALALGLRVFGGVADDMRSLTRAVRRIGQGEIDTPIDVRRNDEIGELARNFHQMRHSLFTDALTGSANRSALQHTLAALTRPGPQGPAPFALLFIDLNRFKPLNDRFGHDNGDRALAEIAQRLRSQLRASDLLVRLGGDEFVAVLPGIDSDEQAQAARQHVEAALEQPLTTLLGVPEGETVTVGAAIGQALYPRDGLDAESLLKHADQDMYRRKGPGAPR